MAAGGSWDPWIPQDDTWLWGGDLAAAACALKLLDDGVATEVVQEDGLQPALGGGGDVTSAE